MSTIGAEKFEATTTAESTTGKISVQINQSESRQLNQVSEIQSAQLKAAGILPELAISGGTELDYVKNNFDKLDKSKDGHVTKEEIDDYIKNHKELSKQEVETLKKVAANMGKLETNNTDGQVISTGRGGYVTPENGITKKDLDVANQRMKAEEYANKNFDKLDKDNDGHVNAAEIKAYMKENEGKLSKEETANLQQLVKDMDRLQSMANDEWFWESKGFTQRDLKVARNEEGTAGMRVAEGNFKYREVPAEQPADKPTDKPAEQPGKSPEPGKKAGDNPSVGDHEYTIKPGDSFWKISRDNLKAQTGKEPSNAEVVKAMNELAKANGMKLTDVIHPGQKLKVPGAGACEVPAPVREPVARREEPAARREEPAHAPESRREEERPESRPAPQTRPAESASQVLQRRFSEIDKDGNNHVTKREIQDYIAKHQRDLSVAEQKALDLMAKNEDKIENFVNDQTGPEHGISRQDLQKLDELSRGSADMLNTRRFDSLDKDHNGFLTKDEITKALTNERLTREERLTLEFLKDNMKLLGRGNNDRKGIDPRGISLADMRSFAELR